MPHLTKTNYISVYLKNTEKFKSSILIFNEVGKCLKFIFNVVSFIRPFQKQINAIGEFSSVKVVI